MPITQVGVPDRILVIEKDSAPCLPLSVLKTVKKNQKKKIIRHEKCEKSTDVCNLLPKKET